MKLFHNYTDRDHTLIAINMSIELAMDRRRQYAASPHQFMRELVIEETFFIRLMQSTRMHILDRWRAQDDYENKLKLLGL